MKYITSAQNEQLKHLAKLLFQAKSRRAHRQTVLEGAHLLQAYLQSGGVPEQVYIPENKADQAEIAALAVQLPADAVTLVNSTALAKITSLTEAEEIMTLIALPQETALPEADDCVVLERVQDPGNVGTILRSAAAAGVNEVILSVDSADVWSPKVLRAGMGAHFLLKIHARTDLLQWRARYTERVWATALTDHNNHSLYALDLRGAAAWVFGNEGSGVSEELLACVDGSIKIPMTGATESLNVAMAATVCLFEQMRQRLIEAV